MLKKSTIHMVQGAVIASLYVALTYAQEVLLPGSTSMAVQFRISELLVVLALYSPSAISGLTVGCAIANIVCFQALPLDIVVGSLATLCATISMYALRNVRVYNIPFLALLMPAIFNGVFIGLEIELFIGDGFTFAGFLMTAGLVALGEVVVVAVAGAFFVVFLEKSKIIEKLFKETTQLKA